ATAVVYLFTPLTAAGQEGSPTGFFTNTRYLVPGLVLSLAMLPIARPLRASEQRAKQTLFFLLAIYVITVLITPRWYPGYIFGTVVLTLALVWAPAGLGLARSRRLVSRKVVAVAGALILLLVVGLGRAQEVQFAENHYTRSTLFLGEGGPQKAYDFARKQQDKRIGIAGSGQMFFGQYGFYGADLSNYVQYIGVEGEDGTYRLPTSCRQFKRLINEGDYDYLIISKFTQDSRDAPYWWPLYAWVKEDPALELLIEEPDITPQPDFVYRVDGELDPSACGK
ncbi:MAG TPA: hypothetical protein VK889_07080, partial [Solirubrobacterales bacterium]|nr:hypothetical protein [Solirubrobacterales bacterium]